MPIVSPGGDLSYDGSTEPDNPDEEKGDALDVQSEIPASYSGRKVVTGLRRSNAERRVRDSSFPNDSKDRITLYLEPNVHKCNSFMVVRLN